MLDYKYDHIEYEEFLKYSESEDRYKMEYDNGYIYYMSPVSPNHERIKQSIQIKLLNFLEDKKCEVFTSEIAVRFKNDTENYLFEPDIMVVCDEKFNKSIYEGLPTLIVEILSYATQDRDKNLKKTIYEKFGIPEYWIVDPFKREVQVYNTNIDGVYRCIKLYSEDEMITTTTNFSMHVKDIFNKMR